MDVCTYLAPSDEKEVQRNWLFFFVSGKKEKKKNRTGGEVAPHIWKLFRSLLFRPFPRFKSCSPVSGRSYWGVCAVKLAVERVPQKDLLWRAFLHPSTHPTPTPTSWRTCSPVRGLEVQQFKFLSKPHCFQMLLTFRAVSEATLFGAKCRHQLRALLGTGHWS